MGSCKVLVFGSRKAVATQGKHERQSEGFHVDGVFGTRKERSLDTFCLRVFILDMNNSF